MPGFKGSIHDNHGSMVRFANIETRNVATRLTCLPMVSTQVQSFARLVRLMSEGFLSQESYDLEAKRYVPPFKIARDGHFLEVDSELISGGPKGANGGTAVTQAFMTQREQTVAPSKNAVMMRSDCCLLPQNHDMAWQSITRCCVSANS